MKHPANFTKKPDNGPNYKYYKCSCPCHYTPGMMHFVACCEGGWEKIYDWDLKASPTYEAPDRSDDDKNLE